MKNLTSVVLKNSKRNEITNRSKVLIIIAFLIVFGFIAGIMIVASLMAIIKLDQIKQSYAFINILLFMNFIILFSESIFHSLNTIYFSNDLKVYLRMPVKPKDLIRAKMTDMIFSQYQMELIMLAIPMVTYGLIAKVSITFYLYAIAILLILPIIPIALTTLIVSLIMRCTNFIKNKSKVMYTTIIIAVLLVGLLLTALGSRDKLSMDNFQELILTPNGLAEEISNSFILIKPTMNILMNYSTIEGLINLLLYIGETFVIYQLVLFISSKVYLKGAIGTVLSGKKDKAELKKLTEKDLKKRNIDIAYVLKEFKIMMRTPIFFIQCILMPIIYPVAVLVVAVALLNFAEGIGLDAIGIVADKARTASGYSIFLAIGQAFFMLNFSSIIAVSKESRSSILMKTLPIALDKQFKLKTIVGIISNIIPIILVAIGYYYCTFNLLYTTMLIITLFLINVLGERFKLLIDLNNPQIKWNTEYTMMKQNTNVMYELFYTIVIILIIEAIGLIANNMVLVITISLFVLIIANVVITSHISKKKEKIFSKLY